MPIQHPFSGYTDSLQLTFGQVNQLYKKYPKSGLVAIPKVTKVGIFSGSVEWEHDCDSYVVVTDGVAKAGKNRFGGRGEGV
jgi:hypothetical protein